MKSFLKMTGLAVVILAGLISVSCGNSPDGDPTAFTGTWSITTVNDPGTQTIGSTVMTLSYVTELFDIDVWLGQCTVSSGDLAGPWSAGAASGFGQYTVSIVSDVNTNGGDYDDQIDFIVTSGFGSTMTGTYSGESTGDWSNISGTFTIVKQ